MKTNLFTRVVLFSLNSTIMKLLGVPSQMPCFRTKTNMDNVSWVSKAPVHNNYCFSLTRLQDPPGWMSTCLVRQDFQLPATTLAGRLTPPVLQGSVSSAHGFLLVVKLAHKHCTQRAIYFDAQLRYSPNSHQT